MTDFLLPQKELLSPKSFSLIDGERRCPVPPRLVWFSVVRTDAARQHRREDNTQVVYFSTDSYYYRLARGVYRTADTHAVVTSVQIVSNSTQDNPLFIKRCAPGIKLYTRTVSTGKNLISF